MIEYLAFELQVHKINAYINILHSVININLVLLSGRISFCSSPVYQYVVGLTKLPYIVYTKLLVFTVQPPCWIPSSQTTRIALCTWRHESPYTPHSDILLECNNEALYVLKSIDSFKIFPSFMTWRNDWSLPFHFCNI